MKRQKYTTITDKFKSAAASSLYLKSTRKKNKDIHNSIERDEFLLIFLLHRCAKNDKSTVTLVSDDILVFRVTTFISSQQEKKGWQNGYFCPFSRFAPPFLLNQLIWFLRLGTVASQFTKKVPFSLNLSQQQKT